MCLHFFDKENIVFNKYIDKIHRHIATVLKGVEFLCFETVSKLTCEDFRQHLQNFVFVGDDQIPRQIVISYHGKLDRYREFLTNALATLTWSWVKYATEYCSR